MRVHRAPAERVDERLRQNGPEPRDCYQIDVVAPEGIDDIVGVGLAIELGAEVPPLDELHGDTGLGRDVDRATPAVDDDHRDGQVAARERLEDRPVT